MTFNSISIYNSRNFKDVSISIANENILFRLNDVGKTNFLYAPRYIFDKDVRKQNLLDSDYHNKDTNNPIEIIDTLDISAATCIANQKLRAQLKGALLTTVQSALKESEAAD